MASIQIYIYYHCLLIIILNIHINIKFFYNCLCNHSKYFILTIIYLFIHSFMELSLSTFKFWKTINNSGYQVKSIISFSSNFTLNLFIIIAILDLFKILRNLSILSNYSQNFTEVTMKISLFVLSLIRLYHISVFRSYDFKIFCFFYLKKELNRNYDFPLSPFL